MIFFFIVEFCSLHFKNMRNFWLIQGSDYNIVFSVRLYMNNRDVLKVITSKKCEHQFVWLQTEQNWRPHALGDLTWLNSSLRKKDFGLEVCYQVCSLLNMIFSINRLKNNFFFAFIARFLSSHKLCIAYNRSHLNIMCFIINLSKIAEITSR